MKKPYVIALSTIVIIVVWMASGLLGDDNDNNTSKDKPTRPLLVKTDIQTAQKVQLNLTVQSSAEAKRQVMLHSDISGRIDSIKFDEGQRVNKDTILVTLAPQDRLVKLEKAKAEVEAKRKAYQRAKKLVTDGYQSESALEDSFALLKSAQASVAEVELQIEHLTIKAPFNGVFDSKMVEIASYVTPSTEIARFVDASTLKVIIPVSQQNIKDVKIGTSATVNFATGDKREGYVTFIPQVANENTRTFNVEVTIANDDLSVPAGISAEAIIAIKKVNAHFISPAILSLDSEGQIGVKVVEGTSKVKLYPVTIVNAEAEGVWVKGLPHTAKIITVGQGFVDDGSKVRTEELDTQPSNNMAETVL